MKESKNDIIKEIEGLEIPPRAELERRIFHILTSLGLRTSKKGFSYLQRAILISIYEPETVQMISKDLYPRLAKEFKTNWSAVERAIRTSVMQMGYSEHEEEIFPVFDNDGRYTNKEFISYIAKYIVLN